MADVVQLDIFTVLQEIEDQATTTLKSQPAPVHKEELVMSRTPFLKRFGAGLYWFWIVAHNLFGIAQWVNVYTVTRAFGGREAGGWYYLRYECEKSRQGGFWEAQALRLEWLYQYSQSHKWGNIRLKAGGQEVMVCIESRRAARQTKRPPYYADYKDQAIPFLSIR